MSDQPVPKRSRWETAAIVGALVAAIVVVTVIGLLTAGAFAPASKPKPAAAPATTAVAVPSPIASASASPTATATATPTPTPTATAKASGPAVSPTPQPTRTASISESTPAAIKQELSVKVVKMEAVTGTADGPGEIAGPSVRFTIRIENTTGKTVALSNTVVNAYYGDDASPAVQLRLPGGEDFPTSVADGGTASGVYLFNIPKGQRDDVQVTVDTSVKNPVIAFQGAAPTK